MTIQVYNFVQTINLHKYIFYNETYAYNNYVIKYIMIKYTANEYICQFAIIILLHRIADLLSILTITIP